ncbi:MAG: radical SAM protein [Nanoarchaeota archaeon]|nr:radical SAM protein [Nanoarchaeota archaeon]
MIIKKHLISGTKVLLSKAFKRRFPLKVNYICTYHCQNKCSYCKISDYRLKSEMNTKEALRMIDSLSRQGCEQITFIGGEPLLREDIGKLLKFARNKGMLTTISTNCELYENKANELQHLDLLSTCLNGPEEVHDRIRGKGNYKKVMNTLKSDKIRAGKIATFIITNDNKEYIDFALKVAQDNGFFINFQPVFHNELVKAENENLDKMMLNKREIKNIFSRLMMKKKRGYPIINSYGSLKAFSNHAAIFKKCHMGNLSITIDPAGNVSQCYKFVNANHKINGNDVGWEKAIDDLKIESCLVCKYGCHIEDNFLFSLNLSSIYNLFRLRKIFNRRGQ